MATTNLTTFFRVDDLYPGNRNTSRCPACITSSIHIIRGSSYALPRSTTVEQSGPNGAKTNSVSQKLRRGRREKTSLLDCTLRFQPQHDASPLLSPEAKRHPELVPLTESRSLEKKDDEKTRRCALDEKEVTEGRRSETERDQIWISGLGWYVIRRMVGGRNGRSHRGGTLRVLRPAKYDKSSSLTRIEPPRWFTARRKLVKFKSAFKTGLARCPAPPCSRYCQREIPPGSERSLSL
ncbi:hypothetical protein ALC53_08941 [Atta colombica]|uniref:Uncharacterized protein n=1 Tax=Atta colombica TaxID=520822 RepID=A0A151I201_9HYME|nr:hypothetical protein ALC53_08941 [Atta colombica]